MSGARRAIRRDRLATLCSEGLSTRQIAANLDRSQSTVRYWLRRYDLENNYAYKRPALSHCLKHGVKRRRLKNGELYCHRCCSEDRVRRMRDIKRVLVGEAGGRCVACGYDRCIAALHFHHRDPTTKLFQIGGRVMSLARLRPEAAKCDLLCANCHAEVEWEIG